MFSEIALHILDILQNSLYASATIIEIHIIKPINSNEITVRICDNGSGMTKMQLRKCFDPFFTTKENKAAGLGIPFFKYAAELSGVNFSVESDKKNGTEIKAVFCTDSIDCIPVGDIFSTVYSAFISNPEIYFYVCIDINGVSVNCDSEKFTNRFYENFSLSTGTINEEKKYLENKLKCFDIYKADSACFADYLKKISVQGGKNED